MIQTQGVRDFGVGVARKHMAGFERVFALLRDHPDAGQERPEYGVSIRLFTHRPHRILYRASAGNVLIVRVLHHRRDAAYLIDRTP